MSGATLSGFGSPGASATTDSRRVVYLLGAGATQGSASYSGSTLNLLMAGLVPDLVETMRARSAGSPDDSLIGHFINDIVTEDADFEQLTTFLEDAPSVEHRKLAQELKNIFQEVLRSKLEEAEAVVGESRSELYAALVDMHQVAGSGESLAGILTLNYDSFLEHAIEDHLGLSVDYGVSVIPARTSQERPVRVLKLHGSFSWTDSWPMRLASADTSRRWIPPGIRKAKGDYPFNTIWGQARELLDCDVLRIVGCRLGANDWDLISLLFTTMYAHTSGRPRYSIEVIGKPQAAQEIQSRFPYLRAKSILELDDVGASIIGELMGSAPARLETLADEQKSLVVKTANGKIGNPFEFWLAHLGEAMARDLPSIQTDSGRFEAFGTAR